uniref:Uncharacterized protein n=1 Tax=Arundo donax TaxID=35708 RepID=A0A0A9GTN2_ARUDO
MRTRRRTTTGAGTWTGRR